MFGKNWESDQQIRQPLYQWDVLAEKSYCSLGNWLEELQIAQNVAIAVCVFLVF